MAFVLPVLLNLSVAMGAYMAGTPPQPSPPKERQKMADHTSLNAICLWVYKYACWAHAVIEITLLIAPALFQQYPDSVLAIRTNHILQDSFLLRNSANESISYPPLRVFAALLALGANWTRYMCYRELGRQYTFQVAIIKDHKLITTGPYSIVRHPSYAAAFLKYISNFLWHASPGAWLWESRFYETKISWLFLAPSLVMFCLFMQIIMTRPQKEDELLKKEFGQKWEQWVEAVPYRLIPGIY